MLSIHSPFLTQVDYFLSQEMLFCISIFLLIFLLFVLTSIVFINIFFTSMILKPSIYHFFNPFSLIASLDLFFPLLFHTFFYFCYDYFIFHLPSNSILPWVLFLFSSNIHYLFHPLFFDLLFLNLLCFFPTIVFFCFFKSFFVCIFVHLYVWISKICFLKA